MSDFKHIKNKSQLKQNVFKVPENYFENLEARLQNIAEENVKVVPISKPKTYARVWSMAASFALLFAASWYFWPNDTPDIPVDLSADDIAMLSVNGFVYNAESYFLESVSLEELNNVVLTENDYNDYFEITQPDAMEDYYLESDI